MSMSMTTTKISLGMSNYETQTDILLQENNVAYVGPFKQNIFNKDSAFVME